MPENLLIPSVDLRIGSLEEYNRRQTLNAGFAKDRKKQRRPCLTISREFGCEAYPVAEILKELMEQQTGEQWFLMDKALLEEVAQRHNISEEILRGLGERNRLLNELLSTFSARWASEQEHFLLLCRHILSLAEKGNVIIVGRGSSIITRHMEHCRHFRLYASPSFKIQSIARRLNIPPEEAEQLIAKKQKQRDRFICEFMDENAMDLSHFHMLFSNDRNSPAQIARAIADYVGHT